MTELQVRTGSVFSQRFEPQIGAEVGAKMSLEFQPAAFKIKKVVNDYVAGTAAEFHLVQIVREVGRASHAIAGNIGYAERCVPAGPHAGWAIDVDVIATAKSAGLGYQPIAAARRAELTNPSPAVANDYQAQLAVDDAVVQKNLPTGSILSSLDFRYAQQRLTPTIPLFLTKQEGTTGNALRMIDWASPAVGQNRATLRDNPSAPLANTLLGMDFQTAVLLQYQTAAGPRNRYIAVVSWGWKRSAGKSDVTLADIALLQEDGLTPEFDAARVHWNTLTVADPAHPAAAHRAVIPMPAHQ